MPTPQFILITGATSGIGRHAAIHLARAGHHVIATGRNRAALDALAEECGDFHIHALELDVTDAASITAARAHVDEITGGRGLDVLINNAGYGLPGPISELDDDALRRQFDTNVFGLMAVTRAFVPKMRERGSGRILNVSSMGGRVTFPFFGAYHATKYAVEALSDALRLELAPFGIRVVLIEPGVIRTGFGDRAMDAVGSTDRPDSAYAAIYARADEIRRRTEAMAVGPECISRAIERAIASRRPAARYVAPFRSRLGLAAFRILPTRLSDALFRRALGLTPATLLPAATPTAELTSRV